MSILSRYVLRNTLAPLLAAIAISLAAMIMERLLRLLEITVNSERAFQFMFEMVINLVPHYLGLALPAAFFIGILLAFNRLSRDSEIASLQASGVGLHRLTLPVFGLALALTALATLIFGQLQPYGRYAYRALVYNATHESLRAAVQSGAFVQTDGLTFMTEEASDDGSRLRRIFVHEAKSDGDSVVTIADEGGLTTGDEDLRSVLYLDRGERVSIDNDGALDGVVGFDGFRWPIGEDGRAAFRTRGGDERELTLAELWRSLSAPPPGIDADVATAELHARLVRILSILVLPFLAVPLGLVSGRVERGYGIVLGLVILVVYHKCLQLGESLAERGQISVWLGIWPPFLIFVAASGYTFVRACTGVGADPLGRAVGTLAELGERLRRTIIGRRAET